MNEKNNPFLNTLRLPVSLPFSLRVALICVHIAAALLPWFADLPVALQIMLSIAVICSGIYYLYAGHHARTVRDIEMLILDAEDNWQILFKDAATQHATFGAWQYVHSHLIVLSLKQDSKMYYFIYTRENLDNENFRHLRVRILHRSQVSST